jgi:hypothetical protein
MSRKKNVLGCIIAEGDKFNFNNNKTYSKFDARWYSKATNDLMAWISKVEDYIRSNYDENSGPYKMLESVRKESFTGYYQDNFDCEITKLKGAIKSCSSVTPNKKKEDNIIIALIKNPLFWTIIGVVIAASYTLGYDNGTSKFDNEKIEFKKQIDLQSIDISNLKREVKIKDSIISDLKSNNK